jgi:hypothetical protein
MSNLRLSKQREKAGSNQPLRKDLSNYRLSLRMGYFGVHASNANYIYCCS